MAAYVRANVRPQILRWARETAGYQPDEAARKLNVKTDRLESWEQPDGETQPTINQLRNMARVYKRPLSVFYLQEIPRTFAAMRDLRRLPGDGIRRFSPELTLEMRAAQERRELMLALYEEIGEAPEPFRFTATLDDNVEELGQRVRDALHITHNIQRGWNNPRLGFNYWRAQIEAFGVLVLQMSQADTSEASGFAIFDQRLPVITVNRNDPFSRRVFSLLHEFVHLALNASGVSDLDVDAARPPEEQRIEIFCNATAAAALMPRASFLEESLITRYPRAAREWNDDEVELLARAYSVSREATVRRLMTFGLATQTFYRRKREQYQREHEEQRARQRESMRGQEFRRNPARDTLTNNGAPFVRLVLNTYHREQITLSEVASFLGVRLKHLPRIRQYLGAG